MQEATTETDTMNDAHPQGALTRDQRRSRRKRPVAGRTLNVRRMKRMDVGVRMPEAELAELRPTTREECRNGPRPCPYVWCKHHLYLDVNPKTGSIKLNFPDMEVWELSESCAMDVAERGGTTLERVGELMNLTRERIRQLEVEALHRLGTLLDMTELRDLVR